VKEEICPGSCNNRYRSAQAVENSGGDANRLRPYRAWPVWCRDRENDDGIDISCTANIRKALLEMPDLFTHLDNAKAMSTPDKQDRPAKGGAPSPSREVDDQDDEARWLWDWERTIREQLEAHHLTTAEMYQPFPVTEPWDLTITSSVTYLAYNLHWILTQDTDLAFSFGHEVITEHRRLTTATKTGDVRQHRSAPCPRCQRRTLVHQLGTRHIECTNKDCGRLMTLDEYDEMVMALAESRKIPTRAAG